MEKERQGCTNQRLSPHRPDNKLWKLFQKAYFEIDILKGWKPAFFSAFGFFSIFANRVRQDVVKLKLPELIQSAENPELFKYPQMAMNREDLMEKTFSLQDQIRYFKSHEDELERRIMFLLESDSYFFTTLTEVDMKARDLLTVLLIELVLEDLKTLIPV